MPGRRPKPPHLKLLQGNPGKRPIPKGGPKVPAGMPKPPTHLNAEARAVWARVAPRLHEAGLLTPIDAEALGAFCVCAARVAEAEQALATEGPLVPGRGGTMKASPWVAIANQARRQMLSLAAEFGLTPSSRSRIRVEPPAPSDDFEDLLGS
jgi:P27 family predicted phage terminase small subunit